MPTMMAQFSVEFVYPLSHVFVPQIETLYTLVSVALFFVLSRRMAREGGNKVANEMWLRPGEQLAKMHAAQYQKNW